MHDLELIPKGVIQQMRDHKKETNWSARMKDAGAKASATRKENTAKKKRSEVAQKVVATRRAKSELRPEMEASKSKGT